VGDKAVEAGGTVFKYEKPKAGDTTGQVERLSAKGPLKSELVVSLLLERGGKNVGVKYEYSIPGEWFDFSILNISNFKNPPI